MADQVDGLVLGQHYPCRWYFDSSAADQTAKDQPDQTGTLNYSQRNSHWPNL